jgi:hypothetical protein
MQMKLLLVLAAVVALASCQKEGRETIVHRNVIIIGKDTIVVTSYLTDSSFITQSSLSKCHTGVHGYGDTIEIMQPEPTVYGEYMLCGHDGRFDTLNVYKVNFRPITK